MGLVLGDGDENFIDWPASSKNKMKNKFVWLCGFGNLNGVLLIKGCFKELEFIKMVVLRPPICNLHHNILNLVLKRITQIKRSIRKCTPTPRIERGYPKGRGFEPRAIPLCDVGTCFIERISFINCLVFVEN